MTENTPTAGAPPAAGVAPPSRAPPSGSGFPRYAGFTGVIAVAVVLLLVLGLAFFPAGGSSNGSAGAVPYSSARNAATNASPQGPWELDVASGLGFANATTLPTNLTVPKNCTLTSFLGRIPSSITIPSFRGNLSNGVAPLWAFVYVQPQTGAELAVLVTDGVANLAFELSGAGCLTSLSDFHGLPSDVIDSPVAASAVSADGGLAFLRAHPTGVSEEMELLNPNITGSAVGSEWEFVYTTCPFALNGSLSETTGAVFLAAVNATTGRVVPGSSANATCGGTPSPAQTLGYALQFGAPILTRGAGTGGTLASQGCSSGDYCYEIPIDAALENVTPGDFEMQVMNSTTGAQVPVVGYAITSPTGPVVVYSVGPVETQWDPGLGNSSTLLSAGMTLSVDMGTANPSGMLEALSLSGTGPFAGSGIGIGFPNALVPPPA